MNDIQINIISNVSNTAKSFINKSITKCKYNYDKIAIFTELLIDYLEAQYKTPVINISSGEPELYIFNDNDNIYEYTNKYDLSKIFLTEIPELLEVTDDIFRRCFNFTELSGIYDLMKVYCEHRAMSPYYSDDTKDCIICINSEYYDPINKTYPTLDMSEHGVTINIDGSDYGKDAVNKINEIFSKFDLDDIKNALESLEKNNVKIAIDDIIEELSEDDSDFGELFGILGKEDI